MKSKLIKFLSSIPYAEIPKPARNFIPDWYKKSKRFIDSTILGLSTVVVIMTIYYHIIPLDTIWTFSLPFSQYITSIVPLGVWMLVPIIALTFTHKYNA